MANSRDQKLPINFSRFMTLSICGWTLIALSLCSTFLYYHLELNFKTNFAQITSYLSLYQNRILLFSVAIIFTTIFLMTICARLASFKTHILIKLPLFILPIIFIGSASWLIHSLYFIALELNLPFGQGVLAIRKYIQNFSIDWLITAVLKLPYQLDSIKIPFYGVIYSYLTMFIIVITVPIKIKFKLKSIWRSFNFIILLIFLIAFSVSLYYITLHCIISDPFEPYQHLLESYQSL